MTRHWWWGCHMLHSLKAVADDSTLALSYRSRVITYETVCKYMLYMELFLNNNYEKDLH